MTDDDIDFDAVLWEFRLKRASDIGARTDRST